MSVPEVAHREDRVTAAPVWRSSFSTLAPQYLAFPGQVSWRIGGCSLPGLLLQDISGPRKVSHEREVHSFSSLAIQAIAGPGKIRLRREDSSEISSPAFPEHFWPL